MLDMSNDRPSVQVVGQTIYLRASSLGKCVRAIAADIMGREKAPFPEKYKQSAREGHIHEDIAKGDIEATYGFKLTDEQGLCHIEYDIGGWHWVISGHYEGIWTTPLGIPVFLWENKSMSANQYKLWMASLEDRRGTLIPTFKNHNSYAWQISHYMACVGLPVLYSVKDRNMGSLTVAFLESPIFTRREIEGRLKQIADILSHPERVERAENCSDDANRWMCPYRDFLSCMDVSTPGHEGYELIDDPEFEDALMLYEEAKARKSKAERDIKRARVVIEDKFTGGQAVTIMGYSAQWSQYAQEDRAALEAFLKEHGKSLRDFKKKGKKLLTKGPK